MSVHRRVDAGGCNAAATGHGLPSRKGHHSQRSQEQERVPREWQPDCQSHHHRLRSVQRHQTVPGKQVRVYLFVLLNAYGKQ